MAFHAFRWNSENRGGRFPRRVNGVGCHSRHLAIKRHSIQIIEMLRAQISVIASLFVFAGHACPEDLGAAKAEIFIRLKERKDGFDVAMSQDAFGPGRFGVSVGRIETIQGHQYVGLEGESKDKSLRIKAMLREPSENGVLYMRIDANAPVALVLPASSQGGVKSILIDAGPRDVVIAFVSRN